MLYARSRATLAESDESTNASLVLLLETNGTVGGELAGRVATGIGLYLLALVTCVGNGMVIHAIRTEKRLRKVNTLHYVQSLKQLHNRLLYNLALSFNKRSEEMFYIFNVQSKEGLPISWVKQPVVILVA